MLGSPHFKWPWNIHIFILIVVYVAAATQEAGSEDVPESAEPEVNKPKVPAFKFNVSITLA